MWFWTLLIITILCGIGSIAFGISAWTDTEYLGAFIFKALSCVSLGFAAIGFGLWTMFLE